MQGRHKSQDARKMWRGCVRVHECSRKAWAGCMGYEGAWGQEDVQVASMAETQKGWGMVRRRERTDLSKKPTIFSVGFPIDFLGYPARKVTNGDQVIAGCCNRSCASVSWMSTIQMVIT